MRQLVILGLVCASPIFAAQHIDLTKEKLEVLNQYLAKKSSVSKETVSLKEVNRYIDSHQNAHIRMQQYYLNYPVWNAISVFHLPANKLQDNILNSFINSKSTHVSMNGGMYQELDSDLLVQPGIAFSIQNESIAIDTAAQAFSKKIKVKKPIQAKQTKAEKIIYIDNHNKARFAFKVSFYSPISQQAGLPSKPVFIIDAESQQVYQFWDDIKTSIAPYQYVRGGGFGGNTKTGAQLYDGKTGSFSVFKVKRVNKVCYMENTEAEVRDFITNEVIKYDCPYQNLEFNKTYWSGNFDEVNGGYSPANDAIYSAQIIQRLYKEWYGVPPVVEENGQEAILQMVVHFPKLDNAFWDGEKMTFGDGNVFFPLTSLGIAAHEVSHGFTQQHSNLNYYGQSGGMNESFSDMAAQAAEYFAYGLSSWKIGAEVSKFDDETLRDMDLPSKKCYGKEPGTYCSIDSADQYYEGLDVHFSSGVYNHFFYLLGTKPNWNPKIAFEVMLHANASYWVSSTQFKDGAACVIKATEDLGYATDDVKDAFLQIGIEVNEPCTSNDKALQ